MARIASCHQMLERSQGTDSPSEPLERSNTANLLISDFYPLELWNSTFLLFLDTKFVVAIITALETITVYDTEHMKIPENSMAIAIKSDTIKNLFFFNIIYLKM